MAALHWQGSSEHSGWIAALHWRRSGRSRGRAWQRSGQVAAKQPRRVAALHWQGRSERRWPGSGRVVALHRRSSGRSLAEKRPGSGKEAPTCAGQVPAVYRPCFGRAAALPRQRGGFGALYWQRSSKAPAWCRPDSGRTPAVYWYSSGRALAEQRQKGCYCAMRCWLYCFY